ncbi:MAG: phosphoribosylformylglycinamidine synthase subunit PurQ [Ginsengibacter sp.]
MKFGVVVFPGSNCDRDISHTLQEDMHQEVIQLWHKDKDLTMFKTSDCVILPGGFSFGDYLRCGAIAKFSPMMQSVIDFANAGGKVFGICNGFQILCESGLLPGVLLRNANMQFVCRNVFIKNETDNSKQVLKIPIAHGEGRYYADSKTIETLVDGKQVLYQYCDQGGVVSNNHNPNGSTFNIAGIRNEAGNVFGMMPHPERASSQNLGNEDGKKVLESLFSIN